MNIMDAIAQRHSVRSYESRPIEPATADLLRELIGTVNEESGLAFSLVVDDPSVFSNLLASYGKFSGVDNVIVCAGPKGAGLGEAVGYWGEQLVLEAQMQGLNTCWVGATFSHRAALRYAEPGQELVCVIAIGYGKGEGKTHPVKSVEQLSSVVGEAPSWFERGMWAAQLAPTALNRQGFRVEYRGGTVHLNVVPGPFSSVDAGIVKRHFELGAGRENVAWS